MGLFRSSILLPAGVALVVLACSASSRDGKSSGPGGPGGDGSGPGASGDFGLDPALDGTLAITPADFDLTVAQGQPGSVDYKVTLTSKAGDKTDVTDRAQFSEQGADYGGAIGTFNGAKLVVPGDKVGKTTIVAKLGTLVGTTTLSVHTKAVIVGAGADASTPNKFSGADSPANAPTWVYPADGVLVPPNMNELELQYLPGSGNQLFELSFDSPYLDLKVYFGCQSVGAGCAYTPDKTVWNLISSAGRDTDALTYRLRATSSGGGAVARSADRKIAFGRENITGGVYYWSAGAGQTKRYEFGVSGQKAESFLSPQTAGSIFCVGCHVLSRDGRFIAVGLDIPGGAYKTFTVSTRQQVFAQNGGSFFSFSPDGTQIMVSGGANISWRNTANGTAIKDPLVAQGTMPDWSADGKSMVYVKSQDPMIANAPGVSKGALEVMTFDGQNWSAPTELVPYQAPTNNYYPTYSPDNAWVLFNRSPAGKNSFGDTDSNGNSTSGVPDGQLWFVPAAGGAPKRLDATSTGKDAYDSWPKWAPVNQDYRGKKLMWFTFSSKRGYGLRTADGDRTQIWMAAFDPEKAKTGGDPAFPPFWLPFQEIDGGNHIAQWVTRVERQPCGGPGACAQGEQCVEGRCIPAIK